MKRRVERSFYGIIADDGEKYDPVNLSEEFQMDGLRVYFEAELKEGLKSFHMWGQIVEIQKIEKNAARVKFFLEEKK